VAEVPGLFWQGAGMMLQMVGASSDWILHGDDGSLIPPTELEELTKQVMEALLERESRSRGGIHSATVSATLAEGRISIEFCVNAATIDEAQTVVAKTLRSIIQDRLGHRIIDNDAQEISRDLELVAV
jgi:hypothetical protein